MSRISKKPEVRKQELLDVAEKLFISKGYEDTSIKDILNEVGGATGMFYHYFSSKEEIYEDVIEQYTDKYVAKFRLIISDKSIPITHRIKRTFKLIKDTLIEYNQSSKGYSIGKKQLTDLRVSMRVLN